MEEVRQQYRASLAELTFNSRPIISSLTMIAGENAAFAPAIVTAIEDQLRNVVPKIKIPVLYLLDSICKNIGAPYTALFSRNMYASFTNAYSAVSLEDRARFKKVVDTWKLPSEKSQGLPLFAKEVTQPLEAFMANFGSSSAHGRSPNLNTATNGSGMALRSQYLHPPQRMHPYTQPQNHHQQRSPQLQHAPQRSPQPQQQQPLRLPVSPNLTQTQLQQHAANHQSINSIVLQQQIQALLTQKQNAILVNPGDAASREQAQVLTQLLVLISSSTISPQDLLLISQQLTSMTKSTTTTSSISSEPLPKIPTLARRQSNLTDSVPVISNVPMAGLLPGFGGGANAVDSFEQEPGNGKAVELIKVRLTAAEIGKKIPKAHLILYDPSTTQCKQCGARFLTTTEAGKLRNRNHLDWHFRQNKRAKERSGRRAVCREWYLGKDVWVVEDFSGSGRDGGGGGVGGGGDEDKEEKLKNGAALFGEDAVGAPSTDKLKNSGSIGDSERHDIPADGVDAGAICAICTEAFEQYCNDDDEWMLKNAVNEGGVLYHYTCWKLSN